MPRIIDGVKLDFSDVLLVPKRSTLSSRSEVDLNREIWTQLEPLKWLSPWPKSTVLPLIFDNVAVSSGSSNDDFKKIRQILEAVPELKYICLDVANGYSESFVDIIRRVREQFANHTIFAGNVVTAEMVEQLILTGADLVKVGIGPGSVCTTRSKAGVGYPQFSAVLECSDAAHGLGGHIISDGGCTCPGDVAKAFGAGADFVMLGGLLAGHDQSGGEIIEKNGKQFKLFYGMASSTAMKKHHGAVVADYRASEGKTISIPYRGDVMTTMKDILGGLRSACTYVGAPKIKELSKRATFVQVRNTTNEVFTRFEV
uniref:GMP reductase n=1 Tax=Meloidogyne hapla TaxID=6305 RepID=A0A1I8B3C4_MELHA